MNDKKLASKIFLRVLRNGGSAASCLFSCGESKEVSVRNGKVESSNVSRSGNVQISVWFGKKVATVSGPWKSADELLVITERACDMARLNQEDPFALLSDKSLWPKNIAETVSALRLCDTQNLNLDEMKEFALLMEKSGLAVDGVSASGGASMERVENFSALSTTEGFEGSFENTYYGTRVSCIAGTKDTMQRWSDGDSARHFSRLENPELTGRLAGEIAVSLLGARPIPTSQIPVVFDRYVSNSLLGHFLKAIDAEHVHQEKSFLDRKSLGTGVFSSEIEIISDPLIPCLLGSYPFDSEGIAAKKIELVSGGVLKSFVADLRGAAKLGIAPTGGIGNLHMQNGKLTREELIAGIDRGLLVMEFLGQGVNITTGDYSRGASGFLIENGKITRPVNEVTVAGNLAGMFQEITPANDMELGRFKAPTLRIDGMTVAGKEE